MLKKAELYTLEIPFKFGYDHAQASRLKTQSLLLVLTTDDGTVGYGETAPRTYVTGETYDTIKSSLHNHLPRLKEYDGSLDFIFRFINQWNSNETAALCLIESALLHVGSGIKNQSVEKFTSISFKTPQTYSATLTGGKREEFLMAANMFHQNNMEQVKLKLVNDNAENIWRIQYIKDLYQNKVDIRVDGNELWEYDTNKADIKALIEKGIRWWEQPFKKDDLHSVRKFHTDYAADASIILDDTITTPDSLEKWMNTQSVSGINIKIAKNGGLYRSIELAEKAANNGLKVQLGAHVGETSWLAYLGALFAAKLTGNIMYHEGCFSEHLLVHDPFGPKVQFGSKGVLNSLPANLHWNPDLSTYEYSILKGTWNF